MVKKHVRMSKKSVAHSLSTVQKKEVKRLIKAEEKAESEVKMNAPTTWAPTITSTASVQAVGLIAQGDDSNQRNADVITMQELTIRYDCTNTNSSGTPATANQDDVTYRFVIVRDMLCDGADPAGTDIFEHASDPLSEFNHVHQLNKPYRFEILHDEVFILEAGAATGIGFGGGSNRLRCKKIHIKLKGKKAKYIGTGATAADLGIGQIFLVFMSNAGSGTLLALDYSLKYTDD